MHLLLLICHLFSSQMKMKRKKNIIAQCNFYSIYLGQVLRSYQQPRRFESSVIFSHRNLENIVRGIARQFESRKFASKILNAPMKKNNQSEESLQSLFVFSLEQISRRIFFVFTFHLEHSHQHEHFFVSRCQLSSRSNLTLKALEETFFQIEFLIV